MGAHAKKCQPSGADRWMVCPGSEAMIQGIKDKPSEYTGEGIVAHKVASDALESGKPIPENVEKEMKDAVQQYIDFVDQWFRMPWVGVEVRLNLSHLIPKGFGTADFVAVNEEKRELIVVDLKYGQGVQVWAEGNRQLLIYGLGALNLFDLLYKIDKVRMIIVQPRLDHIDEAEILVEDLRAFGETVRDAAAKTELIDAPLVPGKKQCRWCRAKYVCKARAAANLQAAMEEFGPLPAGEKMTLDEIGGLLPKLGDIKAWASDLEAYALGEACKGERVRGHKLVTGRSNTRWKFDALETIETLPEAAELIEKKILGITKAKKLLGKNHPVFTELTHKPKGKPTLVLESDKRKEVTPAGLKPSAQDDFAE